MYKNTGIEHAFKEAELKLFKRACQAFEAKFATWPHQKQIDYLDSLYPNPRQKEFMKWQNLHPR